MTKIESTPVYDAFEESLKDLAARARIQARIQRMAAGNPGDHRNLSKGVVELKVDMGPGYRIYCTLRASGTLMILLVGGDKSTQKHDIEKAYDLVENLD